MAVSSNLRVENGAQMDTYQDENQPTLRQIGSFVLSGPVSSEFEFFYAVSVFATRPHILNRSIKGAELTLAPEELAPKFYSGLQNQSDIIEVPADISEALQEPYLKSTIDELKDLGVRQVTLQRELIGHSLREYISNEIWDFSYPKVVIENIGEPNKELPPFTMVCSLIKSSVEENLMEIEVSGSLSDSRLQLQSLKFYKERIVPRIIKWASSNNSSGRDSHPNKAPGVPSTSLKYVPVKAYYEEYKHLKDLYFKPLQTVWTENTDPLKFISEEMGIAAYIKTYITNNSPEPPFSFVDMGCGNGMLTFALTASGASGFGFDIRPRKLWDVFSQFGFKPDLRVQSFNPFCDSIVHQKNLWLIGNHADELTPWISVIARRFSAEGFIVIPCCLYDFHGKFQRKAQNSSDAQSLYQNYIHYIAEIGKKCGYSIYIDKLRIPSTKRVCIIGRTVKETDLEVLKNAEEYANAKVSEFPATDDSIADIPVFKPRSPVEKVNNLTQVDRNVVSNIVDRIFTHILSDNICEIDHPEYIKPWNCGRLDLTLAEAADLLTRQEKDIIQSQGKGLQTLMKNHNQVFRIKDGCVLLRRPLIDDLTRRSGKSTLKVKTQKCYFNIKHPSGCPLTPELCKFVHT